jgi:hypothetical protein
MSEPPERFDPDKLGLPTPDELLRGLGRSRVRHTYLYALDENHNPVECPNVHEWARMFEDDESRRVGATHINGLFVSTVFLGIDQTLGIGGKKPVLFETMIFQDDENNPIELKGLLARAVENVQWRYSTWDEAAEGHETVVTMIREGLL